MSIARKGQMNKTVAHLIPIRFWEFHGRRTSLDASTVDEDVNLAHFLHGLRKYAFDTFEVRQIAFDDLDTSTESSDRVVGGSIGAPGTLHKADVRTRFS